MTRGRTSFVFLTVVSIFVAPLGSGVALTELPSEDPQPYVSAAGVELAGTSHAHNASIPHHVDPSKVTQEGNLSQLEKWYITRMSQKLNDSAIRLAGGEYGKAREILVVDFDDLHGQYQELAEESDVGSDDELSDAYAAAQSNQLEYIEKTRKYRTIRREYNSAIRAGNTSRARILAHRLEVTTLQLNQSRANLQDAYDEIDRGTDTSIETGTQIIEDTYSGIVTSQSVIREREFISTSISVFDSTNDGSYRDPIEFSGQLTAADGTAVDNATIILVTTNTSVTTKTNDSGTFDVQFRPKLVPIDTDQVILRYHPNPSSRYASSEVRTPVQIREIKPELSATIEPKILSFGERMTVRGRVSVEDKGIGHIPIEISLDNNRIIRTRTDPSGEFYETTDVPIDLPPGEIPVQSSIPLRNKAIASASYTSEITIKEAPSRLSISGEYDDSDRIIVTGNLTTTNLIPASNQPITLRITRNQDNPSSTDTIRQTVYTDLNGAFKTSIGLPTRGDFFGSAWTSTRIFAQYEGSQTNLESSSATTDITLQNGNELGTFDRVSRIGTFINRGFGMQNWLFITGIAFMVFLLGVFARMIRMHRFKPANGQREPPSDLLEYAEYQAQANNPDGAVRAAYNAVRQEFRPNIQNEHVSTHWEFYKACKTSNINEDLLNELQILTQRFERAVFGPASIPIEQAQETISMANSLIKEYQTARNSEVQ